MVVWADVPAQGVCKGREGRATELPSFPCSRMKAARPCLLIRRDPDAFVATTAQRRRPKLAHSGIGGVCSAKPLPASPHALAALGGPPAAVGRGGGAQAARRQDIVFAGRAAAAKGALALSSLPAVPVMGRRPQVVHFGVGWAR